MNARIYIAAWMMAVLGFTHLIGIGFNGPNVFVERTLIWLVLMAGATVFFAQVIRRVLQHNVSKKILAGPILFTLAVQLFSPIGISTDFYRYVWQGRAANHGYERYQVVPDDFDPSHMLNQDIYSLMDWREVRSIYPPLAEQFFQFIAAIFDAPLVRELPLVARLAIAKLPFLLLYLLSAWLLYLLTKSTWAATLWLSVPIIQFEFSNSAHIEIVSLCAILGAILLIHRARQWSFVLAGALLSSAVLIKVTPLLVIAPLLLFVLLRGNGPVRERIRSNLPDAGWLLLGLGSILLLYMPAILSNDAEWPRRLLEWSGGSDYRLGNVLSWAAHTALGSGGALLMRMIGIVLYIGVLYAAYASFVRARKTSDHSGMYSWIAWSGMAALVLLVMSNIVLPWYWLTPLVLLVVAKASSMRTRPMLWVRWLTVASLLLVVQYVDRSNAGSVPVRGLIAAAANALLVYIVYHRFISSKLSEATK